MNDKTIQPVIEQLRNQRRELLARETGLLQHAWKAAGNGEKPWKSSEHCEYCGGPLGLRDFPPYRACLMCRAAHKEAFTLTALALAVRSRDSTSFDFEGNDFFGENLVHDCVTLAKAVEQLTGHIGLQHTVGELVKDALFGGTEQEQESADYFWDQMGAAFATLYAPLRSTMALML